MIGFGQITTIKTPEIKQKDILIKPYDSTFNIFDPLNLKQAIGQRLYLNGDKFKENGAMRGSGDRGYDGFLLDYTKSTSKKRNIYKCCGDDDSNYSKSSNYKKMKGSYFTILDVIEIKDSEYSFNDKVFFKLEDEEGIVLYYRYDSSRHRSFPFIIVGYFEKFKNDLIGSRTTETKLLESHISAIDINMGNEVKFKYKTVFDDDFGLLEWKCVDVTISEEDYKLVVILENNQGNQVLIKDIRTLKFSDKIIEDSFDFNSLYISNIDISKEKIYCFNKNNPLECYKKTIRENNNLTDNKFNFDNFQIVGYYNSLLLEDKKGKVISLWTSELREIFNRDYYDNLYKLKDFFYQRSFKNGQEQNKMIDIFNVSAQSPNSANGVSFSIDWFYYNTSKQIKYVYFSVTAYNAVGDPVYCEIRDHSIFTGQATGPIEASKRPNEFFWENAWYNNTISSLKITKVEVAYVDGSEYTYVNELDKIISPYINK